MDYEELKSIGVMRTMPKEEAVYIEGEKNYSIYLILSGTVGLYTNVMKQQASVKKATLQQGDFFGEMSLVDPNRNFDTAIAETEITILVVNRIHFNRLLLSRPEITMGIVKTLNSRIKSLADETTTFRTIAATGLAESNKLTDEDKTITQSAINQKIRDNLQGSDRATSVKDTSQPGSATANLRALLKQIDVELEPLASAESDLPNLKKYAITAPAKYYSCLMEKRMKCPICGFEFKDHIPKSNKLVITNVMKDFRKKYEDFDMTWFSIVACPSCNYADETDSFASVETSERKTIYVKRYRGNEIIFKGHDEVRSIDDVILTHYLAIETENLVNPDGLKLARLWHSLCWLYNDVGDMSLAKKTAANALHYYREIFLQNASKFSLREEQANHLMMGELSLLMGNLKAAFLHYNYVITLGSDGNYKFLQQAETSIAALQEAN